MRGDLTEHFSRAEFACGCGCGYDDISLRLVSQLEVARRIADMPFSISSGCRCVAHNKAVGGKSASAHLRGLGADIVCPDSHTRYLIVLGLLCAGFERIELTKAHVHADIAKDPHYPQEVLILL